MSELNELTVFNQLMGRNYPDRVRLMKQDLVAIGLAYLEGRPQLDVQSNIDHIRSLIVDLSQIHVQDLFNTALHNVGYS